MTKYSKAILQIINNSNEHLTAEQIFFRLKSMFPKVVLATVYNNLNQLSEQEQIRKITLENAADRYDKTYRHDHLICKKCGKISDIPLFDLTENLQKEIGVEICSYDLKLFYICGECRKNDKTNLNTQSGGN